MKKYIVWKIFLALISIFVIFTIVFFLINSTDNSKVKVPPYFTDIDNTENSTTTRTLNFFKDTPIGEKYKIYLSSLFTYGFSIPRGNQMGSAGYIFWQESQIPNQIPILFFSKLPYALLITIPTLMISFTLGLILGIVAAYKSRTIIDTAINFFVVRAIIRYWHYRRDVYKRQASYRVQIFNICAYMY